MAAKEHFQKGITVNKIPETQKNLLSSGTLHLHQVLQNLPDAVYLCDVTGRITFYNKAAVKLWGREPVLNKERLCGSWKIFDVDGSKMDLENCPMAVALRNSAAVEGQEIIIERPNGERRNVLPYPRPVFDDSGKLYAVVNTLTDITDQKLINHALRLSEKNLFALNESINRMIEKETSDLKIKNEKLEQFAYITSHDMQEPLRKIQIFSELLEENTDDVSELKFNLSKIKSSASRMSVLISDLLNYSRLTDSAEHFKNNDLNLILENIETDFELLITQKKATIKYKDLPEVNGLSFQLYQLFSNLISNSLKFCERSPVIEILSSIASPEEIKKYSDLDLSYGYHKIIFSDNGIGFEADYAEKIFEMFQRLHDRNKYKGSGIGLAICKKVVESHFGHIHAESSLNEGTKFIIYLRDSIEIKKWNTDGTD